MHACAIPIYVLALRQACGARLSQFTRRIAIATVFGAVIFVTKTFVPSPMNKMIIVVQALLLAVSSLLLGKAGATHVALIGGLLSALWNLALAPFTVLFALLFGLFVDSFIYLFKVDIIGGKVEVGRLVAAMTLSTMLVGVLSYYVTVHLFDLIPRNPSMEAIILVMGTISGAVAGCLASVVWNKHLKNVKF